MDNYKTTSGYDMFSECRRELSLDIEQATRRRRLYQKFGKSKKQAMQSNTWSVQDHQDFLVCGYSDKQKRFCILPRAVVTSPAFWVLRNSTVKALIMAYNEVSWLRPKKVSIKARAGGKGLRSISLPPEPKPFYLPIARLQAVGVSRASALRAIPELIHYGFIQKMDTEPGKPTVYAISSDYLKWSSQEVGGIKIIPPSQRGMDVSEDSKTGRVIAVAV